MASKYSGGKAWLNVLDLTQSGEPVEGEPVSGAFVIALKKNVNFSGNRADVHAQLAAAFPGCTFAWKT